MAYDKPGVEITQVQQTVSPNLTAPDLGAVLIAPAYVVVPMEGQGSYTYPLFTNSGLTTYVLSGLNSQSQLFLDPNSVYCDLVKLTGATTGRYHLQYADLAGLTPGGNSFTIPVVSGLGSDWNGAQVRIHYRALNTGINGFYTLEAESDIDTMFGQGQGAYYENPLPFALTLALQNTTTQVFGVPTYVDAVANPVITASGIDDGHEQDRARNILEAQEVYAVAPYTTSAQYDAYINWVNAQSVPREKHERIVFLAPKISWYNADTSPNTTDYKTADRATTARYMRDEAAAKIQHRTFFVRPEVAYFSVSNVNVQELSLAHLKTVNGIADAVYALLATSVNVTGSNGAGTFYPALTPITNTVYAVLLDAVNQYQFSVYIPLSGYFLAAGIAGMVAGQNPEQGFTNLPLAGPSRLMFSNDYFSESQLNTMAEGGNYIMVNLAGSIVCRHQLSTDMNSVQERELSITKSVDFVAKYVRNSLSGFIGRTLITPGFLSVVGAILSGLGLTLIKDGRINGFKVLSVAQDQVQPDTVRVSIQILPKYPVNYIKVDLIF